MDIVGAQQDLYYCSVCLKGSSKNLKQRTVSRLAHAEINKSVRDHSEVINTFNYLIQKTYLSFQWSTKLRANGDKYQYILATKGCAF